MFVFYKFVFHNTFHVLKKCKHDEDEDPYK